MASAAVVRAAEPERTIPLQPPTEDSNEMSTDRPDYTESTDSIRPGFAQLEGGVQRSWHGLRAGPLRTIGGPFPLLRLGLTPRLELRLGTDGFQSESRAADGVVERHSGGSDFAVATKIRLLDDRRWRPAFSVIPGISLPAGSPDFSSGGHDPFLKFCWSKELGKGFDAAGNVNFRWEREGTETVLDRGYSLSLGHRLPADLHGFWEIYRISPIPDDERAHWVADTGISRMLGRNLHVDLAIGHTIMARTPCWIFSVGFAVRHPWNAFLSRR